MARTFEEIRDEALALSIEEGVRKLCHSSSANQLRSPA